MFVNCINGHSYGPSKRCIYGVEALNVCHKQTSENTLKFIRGGTGREFRQVLDPGIQPDPGI